MNKKLIQQKNHFNEISDVYYNSRKSLKHLEFKRLLWETFLDDKEYLKKISNVLEPMCGYAEGYSILKENLKIDLEYTGFDFSEKMVNYSKENNPDLNIFQEDIVNFKMKDKFDCIILIGGLHHVYNFIDASVVNIYDSLKVGGYFINFEPTHNSLITKKIRDYIYKKNSFFDYETEKDFYISDYNNIFEKYKFKLVDQMYPGLLLYCLYYNPDVFPFLDVGNTKILKNLFNIEKKLYYTRFAKKFSFSTMSLFKKIS